MGRWFGSLPAIVGLRPRPLRTEITRSAVEGSITTLNRPHFVSACSTSDWASRFSPGLASGTSEPGLTMTATVSALRIMAGSELLLLSLAGANEAIRMRLNSTEKRLNMVPFRWLTEKDYTFVGQKEKGEPVWPPEGRPLSIRSDVQVLNVERVVFDELAACFHIFAHQGCKDGFALCNVFEFHGQQRSPLGIHGGFPELRRGHLAQTFVALNDKVFLTLGQNMFEEIARCELLNYFRYRSFALRRSLRSLLGFDTLFVACFFYLFFFRRLRNGFHHEGRLHEFFDLFELGHQLAVFGCRCQFPVDDMLGALRIREGNFPEVVLFIETRLDRFEAALFLQLFHILLEPFDFLRGRFL